MAKEKIWYGIIDFQSEKMYGFDKHDHFLNEADAEAFVERIHPNYKDHIPERVGSMDVNKSSKEYKKAIKNDRRSRNESR